MGFSSLPAMSIRQPDLGRILATVSSLKSANLKNRLMQSKMDKDKRVANLLGQVMGGETGRGPAGASSGESELDIGAGPAAAPVGTKSSGLDTDTPAMRQLLAFDPERGGQMIDAIAKMNTAKRKKYKAENEKIASILFGVIDGPPEGEALRYGQAMAYAQNNNIPVGNAPPRHDPGWIRRQYQVSRGVDKILEEKEQARTARADGIKVIGSGGRLRYVPKDELDTYLQDNEGAKPYEKPDNTLVKVGDPDSPTGTTYTPRAEAVGKPGPPGSGIDIETRPDGTFRITTGRKGGGAGPLSKRTTSKVEEKLLDAGEGLARLKEIGRTYKSTFLETGTKIKAAWTAGKEKLGLDVSDADKKTLSAFSDFRRNTVENISAHIKAITGAQMNESEVPRLMAGMPNAGQGLFDGDSPTEFESKFKSIMRSLHYAAARYTYALKNGLDPLKTGISLNDMGEIMRKRQTEIIKEIQKSNPAATDEVVGAITRERLITEFGLR